MKRYRVEIWQTKILSAVIGVDAISKKKALVSALCRKGGLEYTELVRSFSAENCTEIKGVR